MRVLVTGAGGFIGGYLVAALARAGHDVVAAVRDRARFARQWPGLDAVACDLRRDLDPADWRPRLAGVDAAINAAGLLHARHATLEAVHHRAPAALFDACAAAGVARVIQISALGAGHDAGTAYAATKDAADRHLAGLDLDWVVLRPSVVYAPGAYGGTALFRALAALPWVTPMVGDGGQPLSPVHVDDLCAVVRRCLDPGGPRRVTLDVVGPAPVAARDVLAGLRAWLGLAPARPLPVPVWLCAAAARIGDLTGGGPLNTTALRMLNQGNAADPTPMVRATGVEPRDFAAGLSGSPAQSQDLWHARLYAIRPLLRWALGLMWLFGGLAGLRPGVIAAWAPALAGWGLTPYHAGALLYAACALDLAVGAALIAGYRVRAVAALSLVVIAGYTVAVTLVRPGLWLDPLGPLAKNLPAFAATLVLAAIARDR